MRQLCYAAFALAITASSAFAQRGPVIVIPGRPDVPVYIHGIDASWGIVEGEFGLDRPNMATETVIWRPYPPTLVFSHARLLSGRRTTAARRPPRDQSASQSGLAAAGAAILPLVVERVRAVSGDRIHARLHVE